jgi:geranylgeranyl diphosphate synthase type II
MKYNNDTILKLFESALLQFQTPEEPKLLYDPIVYSMSGGSKRLRPVLLLLTVDAFGGDVEEALPAGMAVEVVGCAVVVVVVFKVLQPHSMVSAANTI